MTPERWQRVKSLFERVFDEPPDGREALLDRTGESPSVTAEVRRLLAGDALAKSFLEGAVSAESLGAPPLTSGNVVSGHYRIVSMLGRGGMGVVYSAEDLVLMRPVALKFLPGGIARTTEVERMKREARAAAALNHPNICVVYEIGEHEGQPFIAMELLEGQTLRQRIGSQPLKTDDLLDWGGQIADALEAAHLKGVIHRDIKPANILITARGQAKILDFGLAKVATLRAMPAGEAIPTDLSTESLLTMAGTAVGTVPYMSPEQARAEKLDTRTDLFSFGAVLYEMATGKQAFTGATNAVIQRAILDGVPPPASAWNARVPPELDRIIDKALEKERDLRYQHAADMRTDLKRLQRDSGSNRHVSGQARSAGTGRKLLYGLVAVVLLVAAALGWFERARFTAARIPIERQLTHNTPENRALLGAISPDGKHLAYADTKGLYISVIDTGEIHDVPLPADLQTALWRVRWFPDGENLLLTSTSKTEGHVAWVKSIFSGAPRKLRAYVREPVPSPQGSQIAFISEGAREIWVMGANGENPRKVLTSDKELFAAVAWSPRGQRLAYILQTPQQYVECGGRIETVSLEGGTPSKVISDRALMGWDSPTLLWAADGHLIFAAVDRPASAHDSNLWSIAVDPRTGKVSGDTVKVTNWYGVFSAATGVSRDGSRLSVWKSRNQDDVYISKLQEKGTRMDVPKRLTLSDTTDDASGWTPDSRAILFDSNRTGKFQIYKQSLDRDTAEPLTQGPEDQRGATATPDGAWILYWATATEHDPRLMRLSTSAGSPEQVLEAPIQREPFFDCPSRPGASCVYSHREQGDLVFQELDPLHGLGKELARSKGTSNWSISPDGTRVAFLVGKGPRILDLRTGAGQDIHVPLGFLSQTWAEDGDALFVATGYTIVRIGLDGKTSVLLDRGRNRRYISVFASPDGRYLAFCQTTFESNMWVLQNFDSSEGVLGKLWPFAK